MSFSLATSENWRDQQGDRQSRTEWHEIKIFNEHLANTAEQYVKKGAKLYIEGQIETRKFTDKDGNQRVSTEIVLRFNAALEMLDRKPADEPPAPSQRQPRTQTKPAPR